MRALLLLAATAAASGCPPRCNCMKYLGKFGLNLFFTECVSCRGPWKDTFWGDTCETPCSEYLDDNNPTEATKVGRGNCNGCSFDGECRECIDGYWDDKNRCKTKCPENCEEPGTGKHKCSESGSCFGCKTNKCNLANACMGDCPEHCSSSKACNVANCQCESCEPGYWGSDCSQTCNEKGCHHCDKLSGRCLACKKEYYSLAEGCKKCSEKCDQEVCNDDGTCKLGCQGKLFHGQFCEQDCPSNCHNNQCEQEDGRCVCAPGFHGRDCSLTCPEGCEDDRCNQKTGECDCVRGQWDQRCHEGVPCDGECLKPCSEHCAGGICKKEDGTCECAKGFWGTTCESQCSIHCLAGECDQETGECNECAAGHWGARCDKTCDTHCRDGTCNQADGFCKCQAGRWGNEPNQEQCTQECAACKKDVGLNWKGVKRSQCKKNTGVCAECDKGKWGKFCTHTCPANCQDGECDRDEGTCSCKVGYWGDDCAKCPECDGTGICNQRDGTCMEGCMPGKWNTDCSKTCPEHCSDNFCDQKEGHCIGCERGWWSQDCDKPCPPNTHESHGCNMETGHSTACKKGWWTDTCDKACPANCIDGSCRQHTDSATGECLRCKDDAWMGFDCANKCPVNCEDGKCDQSGKCFSCKTGFFGDKCDQDCPANCDGRCHRVKGECESCVKGWWGLKCDGPCHARCGTCDGPEHEHCTSCDDAAQLCEPGGSSWFSRGCKSPPRNGNGKCKPLEGASRYEKQHPMVVLGQVVKKPQKCYCDVDGDSKGMKWIWDDFGSGFFKCYPACPRFMSQSADRCFPNEVHTELTKCKGNPGGCPKGRCPDLGGKQQYEVTFAEPVCLDVESAMLVYASDASVQPAPEDARNPLPSTLCTGVSGKEHMAKLTSICVPKKYYDFMVEQDAATGGARMVV